MSSRTQRFLPTKIQRSRHAPRTKPDQYDDVIREAFDFSRKISKKSAFDKEADHFIRETYQGHIEKRRKAALRRSLTDVLQRKTPMDTKAAAASDHKQIQLTFENVATSDHRKNQQEPEDAAISNQRQIQLDPEDAAIAWIELNAPMASYTKMEQQSHVLFAAAIWMLDRITEQENWRRKLFRLLPRNEHEIEEFHEPDVWDCSYDYDLIASVVNVLYYRNLNVDRKQPIDASSIDGFEKRLDLYEDNPYALTSEYAATHQLPDDWRTVPSNTPCTDDNRERFRALLELIPQEEIDDIVDQFKDLLGDWVDRFYEGLGAISKERELLDQQKARIAEEHNTLVDELEVLIDAFEDKRRSKTVKKNEKSDKGKGNKQGIGAPAVNPLLANPLVNPAKQNPLLSNAMTGSLPGIEEFIKSQSLSQSMRQTGASVSKDTGKNVGMNVSMNTATRPVANRFGFSPFDDRLTGDNELDAQMDQIEGLYRRIENLEDRFNELQDETNAVYKRERTYSFQMSVYGRISNVFKESYEDLPSSLSEPMRLPDVYGLCFALLYLIEIGDDIPWLYGACYGFMMEVCESLPWGMKEYDELDDPIWEYDNDEASVPKTAAIPDLNERKYAYKDSDYYFPRSLAQILYEETGCILPRDVSIYYPEYDTFRQYGIKGKDAGFMMLMSAALSTARRNIHATNLDPEAIRFLNHDRLDPLYSDEDADEDAEGDADADEDAQEDKGIEIGGETARPKDEKDILIDQLKEELKKSRAALHSAEVESRNTRKELASTKSIYEREHRELADLREIVFNAQFADGSGEPEQPTTVSEDTYPYETAKRTTVFGGHDTFLKAIKPMLPNVRFIDSSYMTFSPELVRNSDIVWVQTNCISHPMFWNVVKYAKQYGVQLRYFLYASAEKCADQVVEADKR